MNDNEFTCANCGNTYDKGRSDEEDEADYARLFPDDAATGAPSVIVCDDCFKEIMAWSAEEGLLAPDGHVIRPVGVED